MSVSAKRFPYEKSVVLNILYDALDAIDFNIDRSDSMRGIFLVSLRTAAKDKIRIEISPSLTEETTLVEIFSENESLESGEPIAVLFDEMDALIKKFGIGTVK